MRLVVPWPLEPLCWRKRRGLRYSSRKKERSRRSSSLTQAVHVGMCRVFTINNTAKLRLFDDPLCIKTITSLITGLPSENERVCLRCCKETCTSFACDGCMYL